MNLKDRTVELKKKTDQIINLPKEDIEKISADEIQRIFYDLQVYQIELEMQNDELEKTQQNLQHSKNRYHFLYHQISVGILTLNHQGFIEDSNHFIWEMLEVSKNDLIKKHFTSLIVEQDRNQWINRFDAFFKSPDHKSIVLQLQGNLNTPIKVKIMGKLDYGRDLDTEDHRNNQLIITMIDITDLD